VAFLDVCALCWMSVMQIEIQDQKKKTHNESQPEIQSACRVYRFGMEEKLGGQPRNVFHVGVLPFIEGDSDLEQNISGRKGSEVKVAAPSS
jgi:hypothetical protein